MQEDKKGLEFMYWMKEHPQFQYVMSDDAVNYKVEKMFELMEELKKAGQIDMLIALVIHTSNDLTVSRSIEKFLLQALVEVWEANGTDVMYQRFKDILMKEMENERKETVE